MLNVLHRGGLHRFRRVPDPVEDTGRDFERMLGVSRHRELLPNLLYRLVREAEQFIREGEDGFVKDLILPLPEAGLEGIRMDDGGKPRLRHSELPRHLREGNERIHHEEI